MSIFDKSPEEDRDYYAALAAEYKSKYENLKIEEMADLWEYKSQYENLKKAIEGAHESLNSADIGELGFIEHRCSVAAKEIIRLREENQSLKNKVAELEGEVESAI